MSASLPARHAAHTGHARAAGAGHCAERSRAHRHWRPATHGGAAHRGAPAGPRPIGANCGRKPSANSPSLPAAAPGPRRARKPRCRATAIRRSICSITCSAVARRNRASNVAGIRSVFSIVPVACPSVSPPLDAFDSRSVSLSSHSTYASSTHPDLDRPPTTRPPERRASRSPPCSPRPPCRPLAKSLGDCLAWKIHHGPRPW